MTSGGDDLRAEVERRLHAVADPCSAAMGSPTDIIDLGLLGEVNQDGGVVEVSLVLTDPTCWFFFDFAKAVEAHLGDLPGVTEVRVTIDETTVWTPERRQDGRRQLPLTVVR